MVKNDLVFKLDGATAAPDPRARYVRFVLALCNVESPAGAGGGSFAAGCVGVDAMMLYLCVGK